MAPMVVIEQPKGTTVPEEQKQSGEVFEKYSHISKRTSALKEEQLEAIQLHGPSRQGEDVDEVFKSKWQGSGLEDL